MRSPLLLVLAALVLFAPLASPSAVAADEVLKPTKAQSALRKALRRVPQMQKADEEKSRSIEYLAAWKAAGRSPTPADTYALAQFRQSAGESAKAAAEFRAVQANKACKEKTRDYAASAEAALLLQPDVRTALGKDGLTAAAARLGTWADGMAASPARSKSRTTLLKVLARVQAMGGNAQAAHDLRMQIIAQDPKSLKSLVRPIVQGLLGSTHALDGYDALRTKAAGVMKALRGHQGAKVAEAKKKLDAALAKLKASDPGALGSDGRLTKTSTRGMSNDEKGVYTAQRSFDTAEALMQSFAGHEKPFAMLGKAAEDWTLEKEFGDVTSIGDLKGKVAVLDFWATWPDKNNLPVMRDLTREFGEKGFTVVGVTASAQVVYESRYDTDPDMASKLERGARLFYAARLAGGKVMADESKAIYDEKAYREIEMEAIAAFKRNHEMSWPLVLIDKEDPGPKYALEGWPHIVVLDKEGRIRFFMSGTVARDDAQDVAALRTVIEALLAE